MHTQDRPLGRNRDQRELIATNFRSSIVIRRTRNGTGEADRAKQRGKIGAVGVILEDMTQLACTFYVEL